MKAFRELIFPGCGRIGSEVVQEIRFKAQELTGPEMKRNTNCFLARFLVRFSNIENRAG